LRQILLFSSHTFTCRALHIRLQPGSRESLLYSTLCSLRLVLTDANFRFNVNAYQQKYPMFPELMHVEKSTSNFQCQTDAMLLAALADSWESRNKLQQALENIAEYKDDRAEMIAMEQRESVLKMIAEDEAAKEEKQKTDLKLESAKHSSRPLHLPHSNFDRAEQFKIDDQSREEEEKSVQKIKEYVVQRDSVARLRHMLHQEHSESRDNGRSTEGSAMEGGALVSARKLPRRIFDCPREPPKILPLPTDSLITLAERLRHLDVNSAGSELAGMSLFEDDSVFANASLHYKLKQLPVSVQPQKSQAAAIGTTTSLHNRLKKINDL